MSKTWDVESVMKVVRAAWLEGGSSCPGRGAGGRRLQACGGGVGQPLKVA